MKINDKREKNLVRFGDLFAGDAFSANGDVAIKTSDGEAVCLSDGNYVEREPSDYVELLDAAVEIY